jgi:drug/metabolite transporter (DMT)-like permease
MAAILLALAAAASYGASDFIGGILSKTRSVWMVLVASQLTAALTTAIVAVFLGGDPRPVDFAWAAGAGLGSVVGIAFLYRGLSRGRMGVVAPVSGVGAALLPVVVGLATGDEPSLLAWMGIVVAFPAIYLVAQTSGHPDSDVASQGLGDGVIAGLGFGAIFTCIGQIDQAAGLLSLSLVGLVAAASAAVIASALRQPWIPTGAGLLPVYAFGILGTTGLTTFLLATNQGLLTVVSVTAAIYPAGTVILAAIYLHEKIGRLQSIGLTVAAVAVVLVASG